MAITATTAQQIAIEARERATHLRVKVEDVDGAMQDLSGFLGHDWVQSVEVGEDIDGQVATARVQFKRSVYNDSVARDITATRPNLDSVGAYAPLIDIGRDITIESAICPGGLEAVPAAYWQQIFEGQINRTDWSGETVKIDCRDPGGKLQDVWIEDSKLYGATPAGIAAETIIQTILSQALASYGGPSVTLYTPTPTAWNVLEWSQEPENVLAIITAIVIQRGMVCRYFWHNGTGALRFTFMTPDRAASSPAITYSPSEVLRIGKATIDLSEVRNAVSIWYFNGTTAPDDSLPNDGRTESAVTDAASITKYGRRFMQIAEASTSQISNSTDAAAFANAALTDLREPKTAITATVRHDWRVQLYDFVRLEADNIHWSTNKDVAVTSYRHRFRATSNGLAATTEMGLRGQPSAYSRAWRGMQARPGWHRGSLTAAPEAPTISATPRPGGLVLDVVTPVGPRARGIDQFEVHESSTSGFTASSTTLKARGRQRTMSVNGPPGEGSYLQVVPVDRLGNRDLAPGNEIAVTYGQAGPQYLHPDVNWSGQFLGRGFDVFSRPVADYPPDMWHMVTGTWGTDANTIATTESGDASIVISAVAVEMNSSYIPVRPNKPYRVEFRWQGSKVVAGRTLLAKVEWHSDKGTLLSSTTVVNSAEPTVADTWQTDIALDTAPATARWARFSLLTAGAGAASNITIDTVEWEQIFEKSSAYHNTTQGIGNSIWTLVKLNTETYDLGNAFDSAGIVYDYTVPVAGVYAFSAGGRFQNVDVYSAVAVYLNGAIIRANTCDTAGPDGEIDSHLSVSEAGMLLAAGDLLTFYARGDDTAGTPTLQAGTDGAFLSVTRLS